MRGAAMPFTSSRAPARRVGSWVLRSMAVVPSLSDVPKTEKMTPGARTPGVAKLAALSTPPAVICGACAKASGADSPDRITNKNDVEERILFTSDGDRSHRRSVEPKHHRSDRAALFSFEDDGAPEDRRSGARESRALNERG